MTPTPFVGARWLRNRHAQTIYAALFAPAPRVQYRRERWDTPDGDFIDVDFIDGAEGSPWVQLFHGLEGSSSSPYARMLMYHLKARGWRGSVMNFRGRSGEANRLPRAYHSGDSDEIDWVLRGLRERVGAAPLHAVGVSLGGNALAKWLGERSEGAREVIETAVVVSAPVDLHAAGEALARGLARLYTRHFLGTLKKSALDKLERFPGLFDADAVRRASTLGDFDDVVTAPLHGFLDHEDYWTRASAKPWLVAIRVPTLMINARNDPFLPASALPTERDVSKMVKLEFPERGGHVGFVSGPFPGNIEWLPQRILQFIEHRQ